MNRELSNVMSEMVREILEKFDSRVPDTGPFRDLNAGRQYHFGDPATSLPGKIELIVMNMDVALDPRFQNLRFVSVRVMKSREGGFSSSTCLHGPKAELREQL